jgi:hypothetical protein
MRLVGERKAIAAAASALFTVVYGLNALLGPPEFTAMFVGLAAVYGLSFFGVVAGWFWARWFTLGVGFSGVVIAAIVAFQIGLDPAVYLIGVPHALMAACMLGRGMASAFEGQGEWRARFRMDENGVHRLGKAVTRAGASLPYLIMAGLAPRSGGMALALGLGALVLGVAGLRGLVRQRTFGVLALGGAAVLATAVAVVDLSQATACAGGMAGRVAGAPLAIVAPVWILAIFASGFGLLAAGPYLRPLARALARAR